MHLISPDELQIKRLAAYSEQERESSLSLKQLMAYRKKKSIFGLLAKNEELVGFIVESVVLDEAELIQIVIADGFKRQGYGREALQIWHVSLKQRGVTTVFLEVSENNRSAQALYKAVDYLVTGRRKNYYRQADGIYDAINMKTRF